MRSPSLRHRNARTLIGIITTAVLATTVGTPIASAGGKGDLKRRQKTVTSPSPTPTTSPTATTSPTPTASPTPTTSPTPEPTPTTSPSPTPTVTGPQWGMAGGYSGINMGDLYGRGVRVVMHEMRWSSAEPSQGAYSSTYFSSIRSQIAAYRSQGFKVILNFGMHHAPTWLLSKPSARYTDQNGAVYTGSDEANLIFATEYRSYAEAYTAKVFAELGTDFLTVRVGGGHWGELTYPMVLKSDGRVDNRYWAFDAAAFRTNPVPTWRPCQSSPNGEAAKFLNWYLNSLTAYQNWQIATVRRSYPGTISVLYPSWGMRAGDFDKATGTNLCGTSSPEINGEVQRGYDHARHIAAVTDPNAAAWATWAENVGTVSWLSSLSKPKGMKMFGENAGGDTATSMQTAMNGAKTYGLTSLIWIRASEAYCRCNGWATIEDYERLIASS